MKRYQTKGDNQVQFIMALFVFALVFVLIFGRSPFSRMGAGAKGKAIECVLDRSTLEAAIGKWESDHPGAGLLPKLDQTMLKKEGYLQTQLFCKHSGDWVLDRNNSNAMITCSIHKK